MPVLADYLKSINAQNEARTADLKAELTGLKAELQAAEARRTDSQASQLQTLLVSGLTFQVKAAISQTTGEALVLPVAAAKEGGSQYASAQSSIHSSRSASPRPRAGPGLEAET